MHNPICDYDVRKKINEVIFDLRQKAITREGDTISNLTPEQYQHVIEAMTRQILVLTNRAIRNDRVIEYRGQQLNDIKDAIRTVQNILKKNYE